MAPDDAPAIAAAAAEAGLHVAGVFTFPGHSYGPDRADAAAHDEAKALRKATRILAESGVPVRVRSGGSTPSARAADGDVLTEARPGVYVFGDAQQWELGTVAPADIALGVEPPERTATGTPDSARIRVALRSAFASSWAAASARSGP